MREMTVTILSSSFQCEVVQAESGRQAIEILSKDDSFDLIISDFNMPDGTGADVYNYVKKLPAKIPFVILTSQKKNQLLAIGSEIPIYQKPLSKQDMIKMVSDNLKSVARQPRKTFVPISISLLKQMKSINTALYIRLSATKFVRIFYEGVALDPADLNKYSEKGIEALYIESIDSQDFLATLTKTIFSDLAWKQVKEENVSESFKLNVELLRNIGEHFKVSDELIELTKNHVEAAIKIISKDRAFENIVQRFKKTENLHFSDHCLLIVHMAGFIISNMKLEKPEQQLQVVTLAALIHDSGIDDRLFDVKMKYLYANKLRHLKPTYSDELDIYEHPSKAATLSNSFEFCHPDVEIVIGQHHEQADGSGFPLRLKAKEIFPLSALFIVAEDCADFFMRFYPKPNWESYIASRKGNFAEEPFRQPFELLIKQLK